MRNFDDYIKSAIDLLNETLPQKVCLDYAPQSLLGIMPIGLCNSYDYYIGNLLGIDTLFVAVKDMEDLTPSILAKQIEKLKKLTMLEVVCVFEKLQSFQATRLAKQRINFICAGKQLFLPDFLTILKKSSQPSLAETQEMPAFAQLVVLYHLQVASLDGLTSKEIASKLNTSYATCNRSIRWLNHVGIIGIYGIKEKTINFNHSGAALWEEAVKYMTSPILNAVTISRWPDKVSFVRSGERALSQYTMLDSSSDEVAISKSAFRAIKSELNIDPYGEVRVEIWKYDPFLLMTEGNVDRLSLYLALKDHPDERVSKELETMMKEIRW